MPATFVKLCTVIMDALVEKCTVSDTDYSCKHKWAASPNTRHRQQQAKLRNGYKITVRLARYCYLVNLFLSII